MGGPVSSALHSRTSTKRPSLARSRAITLKLSLTSSPQGLPPHHRAGSPGSLPSACLCMIALPTPRRQRCCPRTWSTPASLQAWRGARARYRLWRQFCLPLVTPCNTLPKLHLCRPCSYTYVALAPSLWLNRVSLAPCLLLSLVCSLDYFSVGDYVSFAVSLSPTLSSLFVAIQQWTLYTLP